MDAIHIVGAGGIGCAVGVSLLAAGVEVVFVELDPAKVAAGRSDGVRLTPHSGRHPQTTGTATIESFHDWSPPADALVLLCTKCYDNAAVLARLPASVRLLPIQNGVDPQLDAFGHAAEGIASFVSECEPGVPRAQITRPGDLHLGSRGGDVPSWLPELASRLRSAGFFRVVEVVDIRPFKYAKLLYNAAISPLAAAAGLDNGKLLSDARARRLFFALLRENYAILAGAGVPLGRVGPFHPRTVNRILSQQWLAGLMAKAFEPGLRGTYCSMAGDIAKGRTEIANYNAHLVALAGETTPCPLNRRAVEVVERMCREGIAPHLEALHLFDAKNDDTQKREAEHYL